MGLKVAIFEPETEGHHLALYTRWIMRGLSDRGHDIVLVTTERATQHEAYGWLKDEFTFETILMPDTPIDPKASDGKRLLSQFARWKNFRTGYQALCRHGGKPDSIYCVNLDLLDLALAVRGSPFGHSPFSGMLVGRQFHIGRKLRDRVFKPVFRRLLKLKTLKKLLLLDEFFIEFVKRWPGGTKIVHSPDIGFLSPLDTGHPRETAGLPKEGFIVLAYGSLSLRKGVAEILAAMAQTSQTVLYLAGRQDIHVKAFTSGSIGQALRDQGKLVELDRFLDIQEEAVAYHAADVVWLGYRSWYGMSVGLVQAAIAKKPVICHDEGLIAHLVRKNNLGLVVDINDSDAVASSIEKLRTDQALWSAFSENGPAFAGRYSPESFAACICGAIEATAGVRTSIPS